MWYVPTISCAHAAHLYIDSQFNLAWKLSLVSKGLAPPSLLSTYNSERLPVVQEMLNIASILHKGQATSDPALLTDPTVSMKDSAFERNNKTKQLMVNYRWSDLVFDERVKEVTDMETETGNVNIWTPYGVEGDIVHPGDRAPEAPGLVFAAPSDTSSDPFTLFSLLRPTRHTVLIFTPSYSTSSLAATLLQTLGKYNDKDTTSPDSLVKAFIVLASPPLSAPSELMGITLIDTEGHARDGYGLKESEEVVAVIIRPDSFVGAFVTSPEGVDRYFSKIFK